MVVLMRAQRGSQEPKWSRTVTRIKQTTTTRAPTKNSTENGCCEGQNLMVHKDLTHTIIMKTVALCLVTEDICIIKATKFLTYSHFWVFGLSFIKLTGCVSLCT